MLTYEDFSKIELKSAKVLSAERIEGSEKLLKLTLDAGDIHETGLSKQRQIVAGIGKSYAPESLVGKTIIIVANLEPRMLRGLESQGMLLAASDESGISILTTDRETKPGSPIK